MLKNLPPHHLVMEFKVASIVIVAVIALTLMVPFIILLGFRIRNRQLRHLKEKQQLEHNFQQEILRSQIEIQQQTLQAVSQEIHDNIGQLLSIVKMQLNIIEESPVVNPHQQQIIKTNELVSHVIEDLRNLAKGVNPDFVQTYGLVECIRFELERLENIGLFKTSLNVSGTPFKLNLSKEFILYRVIQESLNNVIKHAVANKVCIEFEYTDSTLKCSITDNGRGFDIDETLKANAAASGSGLKNMQQRVKMIDGTMDMTSKANQGTNITILLSLT
jgi:two-component system NarL family sensor kinase